MVDRGSGVSATEVGLTVCASLLAVSLWIILSVGWRPALLSPPMWWLVAAFAYSVVPTLTGEVRSPDTPGLTVLVSEEAVLKYLSFVGLATLAFALGWRIAYGNSQSGQSGLLGNRVSLSFRSLLLTVLFGIILKIASALLSGIDPRDLLTTISESGYSFYEVGEFRYSFLGAVAIPMITFGPVLMLYFALGTTNRMVRTTTAVVYVSVLALLILTGVRGTLLVFLITSGLVFVVHPPAARVRLHRKFVRWLAIALCVVMLYPTALWMQASRASPSVSVPFFGQSEPIGSFLDLVTPSAAIFDYVQSNGILYGVSVTDAVKQAPPTILAPQTERAEFLQVVDSFNEFGAGAAVTTPAELYANAGWIVGPVVMIGLGMALGLLQSRLERRPSSFSLVLMLALGPVFAGIFTRGYLWQSVYQVLVLLLGAWVFSVVAQGRAPARRTDIGSIRPPRATQQLGAS